MSSHHLHPPEGDPPHLNPRERLESYLDSLRQRIRTLIYARAAAAFAVGVLVVTAVTVWALNRDGFPSNFAAIGRWSLLALTAVVAITLIWRPLRRLRFKNGADEFEHRLPAQHGRIETYLDTVRRETDGLESPLMNLLAGDAVAIAESKPVRDVIPPTRLWSGAAIALSAAAILLFLLTAGPAYWGYGSRYLLMGAALPRAAVPLRQIKVNPGDITVRRNSDLAIRAVVEGFTPDKTQVFVRFDDEQRWQQAPMQAIRNGESTTWEFKLYALRGPLHYYVTAENSRSAQRSPEHLVSVVDLPRIERVRLTYNYPQWTGLPAQTEKTSRNIRAVAGTNVKLEVFADAPLDSPAIVIDGNAAAMTTEDGANTGSIAVKNVGSYHISARVADDLVALSDDYSIEIVADEKPSIDIQKPGRDWRATSIEEVPVRIQAQDDFRLQQVELRYAVNGGEWQTLRVGGGKQQENSESLLRLEEMGAKAPEAKTPSRLLTPGDLVSYYAVAKDRKDAVQTDLFMVQVQPFERRFTQGQGGGGGGDGMSGEQGAISERQREILLATWNLQRTDDQKSRSGARSEDSAKMLAELQATLAVQTRTLSQRMRARAGGDEDAGIRQFVESLESAAKAMDPAAKHLSERDFKAAVPVEQQALQQLLRAESAFRDVQVAMQADSSGSGGEQASRNFTEMFELEMDVDKNHYETESQLAQKNERDELDDAIRKLKELAERQEKLAQQANRQAMAQREQRWQQEQLRREAEDLRRRLAELSRSQNALSSSSQEQSSRERGGDQGTQQASTALDSIRQALEDMRAANDAQSQNSDAADRSAREAGRNLRQALQQMKQPTSEGMADQLEQLAGQTQQLAGQQREAEADLYNALSKAMESTQQRGQIEPRRAQALVEKKQKMANELSTVQREMRDLMNNHRSKNPQAAQRLGEVLAELENANLGYRLNRSAAEVRYGRAREAAPREGLIAEGLDTLERDLRSTARIAATETDKQDSAQPGPEALLAELSDLRRALQQAQRGDAAEQGQSKDQSQQQSQGQSQNRPGEQSPSNGSADSSPSDTGQTGRRGDSDRSDNGLNAWNPSISSSSRNVSPNFSSASLETGAGQFRREATQISERVRDLTNRMNAGELSAAQINALRRMAHELRRLAGNPMASQMDAMSKLVDQIELATLAAAEKSRNTAAHTSASTADAPEYRETVAEYYRRLGGT